MFVDPSLLMEVFDTFFDIIFYIYQVINSPCDVLMFSMDLQHHCRRCGGLFCNSCTQLRMVLRGQGDSPVRICEPCKKLEEAARFKMRHGHKAKAGKGSTSCSNVKETSTANGGDIGRSISFDQPAQALAEVVSATPEDLRQQALVEKKEIQNFESRRKI
ncbi:pleckstrin homology domain-containing family F member 1-like isoform X5 [Olea europaea var. sylvestris]|uniref:pleckstrin homology domain-containing family F member 1-like isoform X5 n=1 Tax=Olea europaea var. sylvestris TaxID=158386 RepID=UPI000C1CD84F|nr:pleckstrin homology domain-containing family F member 1-like isoform X5 [Olea europaea var. sylvestris]